MATAKTKRPPTMTKANDVDRLASKLGSRLRIADVPSRGAGTRAGKAVRPAQTSKASRTPEESRTAVMKVINNVLQTLASFRGGGGSSEHSTALSSASTGRSALNQLRKQDPKAIDTERAALCMVGKIIPLGILDEAIRLLEDVRNHLPSLYEHGNDVRSCQKPVSLLLLPLPTSSLEPSLQNCIHTYLSHSFIIVSQAVSTKPDLLDVFCRVLDGQTSLHSWTTFLTDLPRKTLDCLIKRYYITLTESFTSPAVFASHLLKIRFHALHNLILATDLDVTAFWEQCLKYATSFARSQEVAEDTDEKAAALLRWFTKIADVAGDRREGKGWIAFCEYWLALAKRVGDIEQVNAIASHIRKAASSSSDASQLVTRTCTTLTQLMVALEQPTADDDLTSKAGAAQSELSGLQEALSPDATIDNKLWRIVDKSRRACIGALSRLELRTPQHDSVTRLLINIVAFFEHVIDISGKNAERADATISALDSLFQLATTALETNRADTCDQAYDYLIRALRLIDRYPLDNREDTKAIANYLRCLSGAFANLAGSLYKAERHGFAIRFLLQACPLSMRATRCYSESHAHAENDAKDTDKDHDMWSTHRSQVYRRWELLGVCYVKTGDRRLAHEAFVQGVVIYPYEDNNALKADDFDMNKLPPSLLNAIDRLTHLAVSELRLNAEEVSLRKALHSRGVSSIIIGTILSRQAYSLTDRTKPHVRMAVSAILVDILATYDAVRHPIRRAETLVRVLEHTYYDNDKNEFLSSLDPVSVIHESEALLSEKANVGEDVALTHLRSYYRIVILFWTLLHSHRSGEQPEHITKQVRLALEALELLVAGHADTGAANAPNVARGRTISKPTSSAKTLSRAGPKATTAASSSRTRTARSNSVRQPRTTPVTTRDALVNKASVVTPSGKRELHASEVTSVAELALMVAELLNLSGHLLPKLQLLVFVRRLLDRADVAKSDVFLRASSTLAHELAGLGKLTLASEILVPLVKEVRDTIYPSSSPVLLLLRYAEILALGGDVSESICVYEDACQLAEDLPDEECGKGVSATSKIRSRAKNLERVAVASSVFAAIQDAKNRPGASLESHLQALRLLNRATDTLSRLTVMRKPDTSADPFAMTDVKDALPNTSINGAGVQPRSQLDGLEWRIANALLETQLALAQAYASRGSVREAEYFGQQAEELARVLGSSAMIVRVLLRKVDLQMALGDPDDARATTDEANSLVGGVNNLHEVDVRRANGDRLLLCSEETEAQSEFEGAVKMLTDTEKPFEALDKVILRGSKVSDGGDIFAPVLRAKILRRQVWLLRDTLGEQYESLLEELFALPQRPYIEVHMNSVLGRLALYDIHERFRADMSLSSLAESTIALPISMTNEKSTFPSPPQDILEAIQQADEHFVSHLSRLSKQDSATNVRCAAVALALISTYQASMGIAYEDSPALAARLLDMSCSITLTRELIEAISFKFPNPLNQDDMRWPSESPTKSRRRHVKPKGRGLFDALSDDEVDDDERSLHDGKLRQYWEYVLKKRQSEVFIQSEASAPEIDSLPENWMVVTVSLTEDKTALLLSRQRPKKAPIVFCVPLKSRHDEDDEGHFTFDDAMTELKDIIKLNDEGARGASQIKTDDKEAKVAWWASRKQLDQRMKDLVENIEFCWLGAFKTMLSQPMRIPADAISALWVRLEKVFHRILGSQEKKSKKGKLRLETALLELFAALPPTCRDEELQDLVYFVLDLYHFHGLSVALEEVDIDLVVIDLRSALEEYHSRNRGKIVPEPDAHTFLVLDKNLQGIPWESLPILRGHSVSRVPSISFITDRLAWARCQRGLPLDATEGFDEVTEQVDRVLINPSKAYYLLNPSGDLAGTESRFKTWVNDLKKVGWEGVVGKEPSEQQFLNALARKDLVVYFGHGGAEQYVRSHKIRHLQRCAATMLWGCSSGALREMGEFDRIGTPNNYMLAGCPSLVANLWDVTDRDIDKFALSVFTKLRLEPGEVGLWQKGKRDFKDGKMSIAAAVAQSRDVCKLKYLTGSAVVVYGIPFYL